MTDLHEFDELMLFAQIKAKPGLYLGHNSLLSLRDYLFGMQHAFSIVYQRNAFEYVLDEMGEVFSFQEKWKQRLERMARAYGIGIGSIKMDCYTAGRCHPLLSGCGNIKLGFTSRIHDVGWSMCLTRNQINLLGGMDALRSCGVFCSTDEQENGSAVLQLTSDVSVVPQKKAKALWELISSHIELVEYQMNSVADIPPSMRLGIPIESLKVNELGQYRFVKN